MKFVKRISLFFIYPCTMFALGFASNMAIMDFFYPKNLKIEMPKETQSGISGKAQSKEEMPAEPSDPSGETALEVAMNGEPLMTADTHYIIQEYDTKTDQINEKEEAAPDKFIGLNRDMLSDEITEYNRNPSLTDLEQGFTYMELVSFSPERVVVRKSYEPAMEEQGFFLLNENHYVVVYDHSLSKVYMNTDILVERLPEKLQEEIIKMKYIEDERELYNFLESYTS